MATLELTGLVRGTHRFIADRLESAPTPSHLFLHFVTPLVLIRSMAVLLRSLINGDAATGFVLAIGNLVLQIGVWVALGVALPVLVKQFGHTLDDRRSFALMAYASAPLWAAGILYLVPEEPPIFFFWSRLLVAFIAGYGVYILAIAFEILGVKTRSILLVATTVGYSVTYLFFFGAVGVSSTVLLLLLRTA